jgi:hypothetical protein
MDAILVRRMLRWIPAWSGGCSNGYQPGVSAQMDTQLVRRMLIHTHMARKTFR